MNLSFCINTLKTEHKMTHKCRKIANFAECFENY